MATICIPIESIPFRPKMETYDEPDLSRFGGFPPPRPEPPKPVDLLEKAIRHDNPGAKIERLACAPGTIEQIERIERQAAQRSEQAIIPVHLAIARDTEVMVVTGDTIVITAETLRTVAPGLMLTPPIFTRWRQGESYLTHYHADRVTIDSTPSDPGDPDLAHYQLWIYRGDKMLDDKLSRSRRLKNGPLVVWGPTFDHADVSASNQASMIDLEMADLRQAQGPAPLHRTWRPGQEPAPAPRFVNTRIEESPPPPPRRSRRLIGVND